MVCAALRDGRQSVLLRKGGIIEETRDFALIERRFFMYPTYEHQDAGSVHERFRQGFRATLADRPPDDIVRIDVWAEVTDLFLTHDIDALLALSDHYAWSPEYIRMRMAYKPRKPMNVVVVRAYALPAPAVVPVEEHFAGCKSWVPLESRVSLDGSVPALDEERHATRLAEIVDGLGEADRVAV